VQGHKRVWILIASLLLYCYTKEILSLLHFDNARFFFQTSQPVHAKK